jgi:outer membrane protein assembly factor BamE (lipoprotein component of BamABCDE complex)
LQEVFFKTAARRLFAFILPLAMPADSIVKIMALNRFCKIPGAIFAAGILCLQTGCMTSARKLEQDAVKAQLHIGQTQTQVRHILGNPVRSISSANGKTVDFFAIMTRSMRPAPPGVEFRSVCVLYGSSAHLEKFTWYKGETMNRINPFLGRIQTGRVFTPADLARIKRGVTTGDEMIHLFGRPTIEGINTDDQKTMSWLQFGGHDMRLEETHELTVVLNDQSVVTDSAVYNDKP